MKRDYLDNLAEAFLQEIHKDHDQKSSQRLTDLLWNYLQEKGLGPLDMERLMEKVESLSREREQGPVITIMSAQALSQKLRTGIEKPLREKIKKFQAHYIIEPKLIGGFRIQVGDTVYDYSIAHSLQALRSTLTQSI